jgi:hypothetical protein
VPGRPLLHYVDGVLAEDKVLRAAVRIT